MNLPEMKWMEITVNIAGFEMPAYVLILGALLLLIALLIKIVSRSKKRARIKTQAPEAKEELTPLSSNEPKEEQESAPYNQPATAVQTLAEEKGQQEGETVQAVSSDLNTPESQQSSVAATEDTETLMKGSLVNIQQRLKLIYTLMPELGAIEFLEGFKEQGVTTLDIRDRVDELLQYAGALETSLSPRSLERASYTYNKSLLHYIDSKMEEIDNAYMTKVFKPEQYLSLGCFYYRNRLFDKALECFDKALKANQYNSKAWNNKAVVLMEKENYEDALDYFTRALQLMPDSTEALFGKGIILCDREGDLEEGLKYIDKALELNPLLYDVWYEKGLLLSAQERFDEALLSFDRAIAINPQDERPWQGKGIALSCLGRHEEAYRSYEQAISIKPGDEEAWYGKSIALSYLGLHEEAIVSFDFVIALNKDNYKAWFGRGLANLYLKKYEQALLSFENTLKLNRSYAKAWYNKAVVHCIKGDRDQAIDSLQRAVELEQKYRARAKNSEDFNNLRSDEHFIKICSN